MSRSKTFPSYQALALATTFASLGLGFALIPSVARAQDRFVVPTSSSSSSPSSSPSSSSSSSNSYSPSSSSDSGNSYSPPSNDSGRFNVPVPNHSSVYTPSGPQPGGGHGHGHGGYSTYVPYWGGYYYWGGDYYYWGGQRYLSDYGLFGRYAFYSDLGYVYRGDETSGENAARIFFPPSPPPIGAPIPPKQVPGERIAAPADLAIYVYEPFYAPLSTRLAEQDLTKKLMTRLDSYRTKRAALQVELQSKLDSLKDAAPADRIQQLETFAREQSPRIAELENTADQLRSDLLRSGLVGLFSGTGDWNQSRNWYLGLGYLARPRAQTLVYEFLVMRAAIFYQEGLSPAQRRLLREVAMELQVEAYKPKTEMPTKQENTLVFFSPETARINVSDDLPADLLAKISAYQSEKNAIKTELRDTLYQQDITSSSHRVQVLKQLADSQAPRIAALEGLADDIRAGLSRLPKPPGPTTAPAFPADLATRISAYQKEKLAIQKLIQSKLDEIRERLALTPDALTLARRTGDDNNSSRAPFRLQTGAGVSDEKTTVIRQAIQDLNKKNEQRFTALAKERDSIREAVARFAGTHLDAAGEKTVHSLLHDFFTALREEETWQPYQDYQTAVYQPGLSPEQRRLLFEVALEKLALPLPDGEFQQ